MPAANKTLKLWRVSNYHTLEGLGGLDFTARWHTAGHPVVYLADSPAGALLETLVHLEVSQEDLPPSYTLLAVEVPADLRIETIDPEDAAWNDDLSLTRKLGDAWLASRRTALLSVPSALVPRSRNYLLNPRHPRSGKVVIREVIEGRYDSRLFRIGPG